MFCFSIESATLSFAERERENAKSRSGFDAAHHRYFQICSFTANRIKPSIHLIKRTDKVRQNRLDAGLHNEREQAVWRKTQLKSTYLLLQFTTPARKSQYDYEINYRQRAQLLSIMSLERFTKISYEMLPFAIKILSKAVFTCFLAHGREHWEKHVTE